MTDLTGHPLAGVKVLDLGQIYNGPYAGFLLAMAGADVIKVEPITGEAIRDRSGRDSVSFAFGMLNSNKRDIAIDLKTAQGKALLIELAKEADILLENFAPGALDQLGVGAAVLQAANPRLIYASSTGYGLSGPRKEMALAYRKYSDDYTDQEAKAKAARRGLWAGQFVPPWEWRRGKRLASEANAANDNPEGCRIKGNIGSKGDRIYHMPGGRWYDKTVIMASKGERWFCSEGEAKAAGWRAPPNLVAR